METKNKTFIDKFATIDNIIGQQVSEGYETLIDLCKANGGFLPTMPTQDKCPLKVYYEDEFTGDSYSRNIYGFHYDERGGLQICTDDMIDTHEYYPGDKFDEDILLDASNYVAFNDYYLLRYDTIMSILNGINQYL